MKVSYSEGVATHTGSESYTLIRKNEGEALTGVRAGQPLSREIEPPSRKRWPLLDAHAVERSGKQNWERRYRETLLHLVYEVGQLRAAYFGLKREAAPGIDATTWRQYGEELERNLFELSQRIKRGAYRAQPVRRAYIRKADEPQKLRPLGVLVLEDKIVQRAMAEVLSALYEQDFVRFSYGFRP